MWSARVTKDKRDQRKRSHIYVALDVSDQDKIFGAAVANVSVDRDGTSGVTWNVIGQIGRRGAGLGASMRIGWSRLGGGDETTRLAEGRGKERAS